MDGVEKNVIVVLTVLMFFLKMQLKPYFSIFVYN